MRKDDPVVDKVKVTFPSVSMVIDAEDASTLFRIMGKAEEMDTHWESEHSRDTITIYPLTIGTSAVNISVLTNHQYNMAKLANDEPKE